MEPNILLAKLRALLERAPDLENYSPTSREHMAWLGQAHALIKAWDWSQATSFSIACDSMASSVMRDHCLTKIFGLIHRAIADLELKIPSGVEVSFGVGEVYDFFRALNKVISSAEKSLFIIDPYLDSSVFDHYLNSRQPSVKVRLLLSHKPESITPAAKKYIAQHGSVLEVRESKALHDRVVFVDNFVCWLIGQSVKDAAKAKPTYLAPLAPDVVPEKLSHYESIWSAATAL